MDKRPSKSFSIDKLPIELTLVTDDTDDGLLAETLYARKFSLQSLEKDNYSHVDKRKSVVGSNSSDKLDKNGDKTLDNGKEKETMPAPKDDYNAVKIIIFILGLIHFLPYSFFTTANEYWMYKFRDPASNSTDANDRTYLQANYASLNYLISMVPSTMTSVLLMFYSHKINAKTRVFLTLTIHSVIFVMQSAFVEVNTDDWQVVFFWITMIITTILVCSTSIGSAGNMVTVSQFPDDYMKAYLIGEGAASLINSAMRLVSIVCAPSVTGAALIYFVTGTVLMSMSSVLFYWSTKLKYYRYYTKNMKQDTKKKVPKWKEFKSVLKYIKGFLLLYVIMLAFPFASINTLVVSEYYGTGSVWGDKYFVTCITYLLPAICGSIGRLLFYKYELDPPMYIVFITFIARELIFPPLIYFVNAKPRTHLPVLFPHDWQYALIMGMQSLSGGYLLNILTLKQMRSVPPEKLELSWMVMFLVVKVMGMVTSPLGVLAVSLL